MGYIRITTTKNGTAQEISGLLPYEVVGLLRLALRQAEFDELVSRNEQRRKRHEDTVADEFIDEAAKNNGSDLE